MRRGLLTLGGLALFSMIAPPVIEFVQRCGGNRYPGTAQQAGAIGLLGRGKQVAYGAYIFHGEYGNWPATLAEVIQDGLLTNEQVRSYPNIDDLPDMRDIRPMKDLREWLYIRPQDDAPDLPMVVAPRPYTSSMGRTLAKPRRIVVDRATVADSVEEEKIAPVLQKLSEN